MPDQVQSEKSIFLQAIELTTAAERAAYVDQACEGNPALRTEVEALMQAHEAPQRILDIPEAFTPITDQIPLLEKPGSVIGPYRLLQQLGEGGMGTVLLAEQTHPVQRKVAIKVIKPGMNSRQVLARFEQERQALAVMDHPNISRVLDAGTTDTGRPFFVMELVKGVPITDFCDREHLTVKERLELFIPVCQAVQHAHQKGIIHRDLKPSNVLIALYDGEPVPKVIDFGVAKATGQKLTDRTVFTEVGQVVGTLEYMAPEQAELNNLDIDTRADIYALGTVLYELLAGSPPFTREQLKSVAFTEMLRMIREVEPHKPSTRLSSSTELPNVAAKRKLEPKPLTRLIQGDLDWIVMKCLDKERSRRYETANGLAVDIGRNLADEPVLAGPPSAVYQLRKFVRRNRGAVIAVSFVLLSLVLGVTGTTLGLVRAEERRWEAEQAQTGEVIQRMEAEKAAGEAREARNREFARAEGERHAKEDAEKNLGYARKGNKILGSVFSDLDPDANYTTVAHLRNALRDNLYKAVKELEGSAIGDPLEVAGMQNTLGVALLGLGEESLAVEVLQKALDTRKAKLGPEHFDTLTSMNNLAGAYQASGHLDKAVLLYEQTLEKARLGPEHTEILTTMNNLAGAYQDGGQFDKAVTLFEQTLEKQKAKLDPGHPHRLACMNNLARAYQDNGQLDKALPLYEETLQKMKAKLEHEHPLTLLCTNNLAGAYLASGRLDKALPLYEETLERQKAKLGHEHPNTLITMNNLAGAYQANGQFDKAVQLYEQTLEKRKFKLGHENPQTLISMNNLAVAYQNNGQLDKALPLHLETLEKQKAKLGHEHPNTLTTMTDLAEAFRATGQLDKALPLYEETLVKRKAKLGPGHPDTLTSMNDLAGAYRANGQLDKALPLYEETLEKRKAKLGPEHPDTLISMNDLGGAYQDGGQFDKAVQLFEDTLKKQRVKLGPEHPHTLTSMNNLAGAYKDGYQLAKAVPLFEETLERRKAKLGPEHPRTLETQNNLAVAYVYSGRFAKAVSLLEQTLERQKVRLGPDHPDTLSGMGNLAGAYLANSQLDKAVTLFEETLEKEKTRLGSEHPHTLNTQNNLAVTYLHSGQLAKAFPLLEQTLEKRKARLGADHPDTLNSLNNLAGAYQNNGQFDKAIPIFVENLKKRKVKLGPDHPDTLVSQYNLADAYRLTGKADLALPLFEETLKLRKARLGPDHPETLKSMSGLATWYWSTKQLSKSIPLFEEALKLGEKTRGRQHPETLSTVANMGVNYKDADRLDEALPLLEEAYRSSKKYPTLRWVGLQLLDGYSKSPKGAHGDQAKMLTQELLADARREFPNESPQLAGEMSMFGLALLRVKAFSDAEPILRACLAIREKKEAEAWNTFNAKSMLGGSLLGQKKYAEAEPLLLAGYEGMKKRETNIPLPGKIRLIEALERLVWLYDDWDKRDEADMWRFKLDEAKRAAKPQAKP